MVDLVDAGRSGRFGALLRRRIAVVVMTFVVACGASDTPEPVIDAVIPPVGPLRGGQLVTISGRGFLSGGAVPDNVLFGDTQAEFTSVLNDKTLLVRVPPGQNAGDIAVTVLNRNGYVTTSGVYRYTSPPTIADASPQRVLFNAVNARVTLKGSGFATDDAGVPTVTVNGIESTDPQVISDTEMSVVVPPGLSMSQPVIRLQNGRGDASAANLFRYVPTLGKGFLLFSKTTRTYALFYDPEAKQLVNIPSSPSRLETTRPGYRALFVDADGGYWAYNRDNQFGQIDFSTQNLTKSVASAARVVAFAAVGSNVFAFIKDGRFGKYDKSTGQFTPIGNAVLPSQPLNGFGLALVGNSLRLLFTNVNGGTTLITIDPTTGAFVGTRSVSPPVHAADLRSFNGVLYAVTNTGDLVSIDPATGISAVVETLGIEVSAMETFE
jgi:IPT/TIG domain